MFKIVLSLALLFPALAIAVPYCSDIFTDPPTGDHGENGLTPPANIGPPLGDLSCTRKRGCDNSTSGHFLPGDYSFSEGDFHGGGPSLVNHITTNGTTARLYFDRVSLSGVSLNTYGKAEDLIIYVGSDLTIAGHNHINGIIYVAGNVSLTGNGSVTGGLAAGGSAGVGGNGDFVFDEDAIDNADFGGMCIPGPKPDLNHYRIEFSSDALSCTAKSITIKSCANDDCSSSSPLPSSVELTKDGVKYSDVSFTGETDTQLWHGEGGLTTIGLGATSPVGPYRCYIDGNLVDNSACSLNFAESGFIVSIDNYLSNKPQENIAISAVRKSDNSLQCVPAFADTTKEVNFWSEYISPSPAAIVTGSSALVNGTNIGTSALNPTPRTLTFNGEGKAEFELNYPDAGKIAIHAKYTAPAGEEDEGLVMEGSDSTVRYPVGLCIKPETVCSAGDDTCPKFKIAGETFNTSIQAMAWQLNSDTDYCNYSSTTPNYVQAGIALGHALKQPVDGALGELGLSSYDHVAKANSLNGFEQSIGEVGVFTLTATPPNGYLGESINIPSAESEPVGRFYPQDFELYEESMLATCGTGVTAFTYMDEPTPLMMKIRARNLSGVTTRNYFKDDTVDFASGTALLVAENSNAGGDYRSRLTGLTELNWEKDDQGVQAIESDIQFTRLLDSNLDGPYASMAIGVQMSDKDGVLIASPDMNAGTVDDCSISDSCNAKQISTQHYRHGRIVLENAYGPETDTIRMPVTAEYWDGAQWVVNTLDSCTDIASAALPATDVTYNPALISPQSVTRAGGTNTVPDSDFSMGRFELLWHSLIATPNRYRGQVTAPLAVPAWLQWYWNWNSDGALSDPRASAFFGTYRGHDRVIQWREVL
ncbi:MSHA biogenesis protein MshQ [Shewanella atlantica]|uniref:MSHA biogenesis protein MshQ n=1 Tax=Shewanella atlantica TaxID=271099 RepID=A0A431W775_9GAMM|nr:MSHA biogenesis protein MshQ [Shewanella atlantica]